MKFDKNKAFPYPVLRPSSDDYKEVEFQVMVEFAISDNKVTANILFANSCDEISDQIEAGNAAYVCVISCRDTYIQRVIETSERSVSLEFESGKLRGEVRVDPYVVVKEDIVGYSCPNINLEFGPGPFSFQAGDVLAQDETQVFYIDREVFKSITSVFDLVKKDSLTDGLWTINFDDDHIRIEVSPKLKESIDDARNDSKNRVILKNSIYFAAVMQAVQKLQDKDESFEDRKWAKVFIHQAHNRGIDLENHDAYLVAQQLMQLPALQLDALVFKGGNQ
ncbi:MAG: hypothetical protein E6Q34_02315 [Burkholderiaceae bacterium]|nr:MAG: hypothetical protein E6Q34_02315 [Burkholderiaceae bacterium]